MPEPNQNKPAYPDTQFRIMAVHPETGEQVCVCQTKFQHSLSAVSAALSQLGIEFSQVKAV